MKPIRITLLYLPVLMFIAVAWQNKYKIPSQIKDGMERYVAGNYKTLEAHRFISIIKQMSDDSIIPLKNEKWYQEQMGTLLNGDQTQRLIAYAFIDRLKDNRYADTIYRRFQIYETYNESYNLPMVFMQLFPGETDKMFDFLMKHETFGDVIWSAKFLYSMNTDHILKTAYVHIDDEDKMARILAMGIIAIRDQTAKGDATLKKLLNIWPTEDKGYIIYHFQDRNGLELKPLFEPYLNDPRSA